MGTLPDTTPTSVMQALWDAAGKACRYFDNVVGLKTKPLFCMFSSAGMLTCGVSATAPQCGFGGGGPLLLNHFYWIKAIPDCQLGYQSLEGHSRLHAAPF